MRIVNVTLDNNIDFLKEFISKIGIETKSFRYYNSRPLSVIKNHLATLLFIDDEKPIAYGHLDREKENIWLGICVLHEFSGKGYGEKMMNELIKIAKKLNILQIVLTVDKDNFVAINLYEKMNFFKIGEDACYYKYQYNL